MEKRKTGYMIDISVLQAFDEKIDTCGIIASKFVEGCMRAFVEGKFRFSDGEPVFPQEQDVSRETQPDLERKGPGRPKESKPEPVKTPTKPKEPISGQFVRRGDNPKFPLELDAPRRATKITNPYEARKLWEVNELHPDDRTLMSYKYPQMPSSHMEDKEELRMNSPAEDPDFIFSGTVDWLYVRFRKEIGVNDNEFFEKHTEDFLHCCFCWFCERYRANYKLVKDVIRDDFMLFLYDLSVRRAEQIKELNQ